MTRCKLIFGFVMVVLSSRALADVDVASCPQLPPSQSLSLIKCDKEGRATVAQYRNEASTSPYSTEFDSRSVIVIWARQDKEKITPRSLTDKIAGLLSPPEKEQIATRERATSAYKKWSIKKEVLQYRAEGGALGYVIQCAIATARRSQLLIAVGECFPLEEESRFWAVLDSVAP